VKTFIPHSVSLYDFTQNPGIPNEQKHIYHTSRRKLPNKL